MLFVIYLHHTPTSEDSSVAAGATTVATSWVDGYGGKFDDTGGPFVMLLFPWYHQKKNIMVLTCPYYGAMESGWIGRIQCFPHGLF